MKRLGTAVVALLAVVALAGAAGTFDAVDGPVIEDDGATDALTMTPPEPGGVSPGNWDGDDSESRRAPTRTTSGPADDSDGFSPLVVPGVVGSLFASALLVVVLTGDDDRVPDAPADDDGGSDPLPSVDPDYDSPDGAVARAWRTLRDRAGADGTATPTEVAARALDRRLPSGAVSVVTERFRAVRYDDDALGDAADEAVAAARRLEDDCDEDGDPGEHGGANDDRS